MKRVQAVVQSDKPKTCHRTSGTLLNIATLSEAGDVVDGPCNACTLCDCAGAAPRVATKLFLREYLYGENASGRFSRGQ